MVRIERIVYKLYAVQTRHLLCTYSCDLIASKNDLQIVSNVILSDD